MPEMTFIETSALTAQMEDDQDSVDELLGGMSYSELTTFEAHLRDLADRVSQERSDR
jgi:hypothetical protein